jgi:hypothetical protein
MRTDRPPVLVYALLFVMAYCLLAAAISSTTATPRPAPIDPPAYCYSNARGVGFLCSDLKGEFNV